jgi:hypothetical protein
MCAKGGLLTAALAVLCAAAPALRAEEWRSPAYNCAIQIPAQDGWQVTEKSPLPDCVVTLTNEDEGGKRNACLLVWKLPDAEATLDRQFLRDFQGAFFKPPLKKLEGTRILVDGVPGYEAVGVVRQEEKDTYNFTRVMLANGYAYRFDVVTEGVDVREDAKAGRLLAGFHFIEPPPPQKDPGAKSKQQIANVIYVLLGILIVVAATKMFWRRRSLKGLRGFNRNGKGN